MIGRIDITEKWGWYNAFWVLADEQFTKIEEVSQAPFRQALTALAFMKDKRHEANA